MLGHRLASGRARELLGHGIAVGLGQQARLAHAQTALLGNRCGGIGLRGLRAGLVRRLRVIQDVLHVAVGIAHRLAGRQHIGGRVVLAHLDDALGGLSHKAVTLGFDLVTSPRLRRIGGQKGADFLGRHRAHVVDIGCHRLVARIEAMLAHAFGLAVSGDELLLGDRARVDDAVLSHRQRIAGAALDVLTEDGLILIDAGGRHAFENHAAVDGQAVDVRRAAHRRRTVGQ